MKNLLAILLLVLTIGAIFAFNSSEIIEQFESYADDTNGTNCMSVPATPVPPDCSVANTGVTCTILVGAEQKYIFAEIGCVAIFRRP